MQIMLSRAKLLITYYRYIIVDHKTSQTYILGFDWSDGNLRLVDMQGNKLLGSELTVHDRSVDIPLQPWLEAADSFFRPYPQNEPFFAENVY